MSSAESCVQDTIMNVSILGAIENFEKYQVSRTMAYGRLLCDSSSYPEPYIKGRAAVLLPLFVSNGVVFILLTKRSQNLASHRGEVCLPGGKEDDIDGGDPVRTALREAEEEIGLLPQQVKVIQVLGKFLSKHQLEVTPVVGLIPNDFIPNLNRNEVESCFSVPLHWFLCREVCFEEASTKINLNQSRSSDGGRKKNRWHECEECEWTIKTNLSQSQRPKGFKTKFLLHKFTYEPLREASLGQDIPNPYVIWGLTAHICIEAASIGLSQSPEFTFYYSG